MKSKIAIFFMFFLLPISLSGEEIYPNIKDIKYESTPLHDFFNNYESFFLSTFSYLFFELKMDELDENSKRFFYKNFVDEKTFCVSDFHEVSSIVTSFCSFSIKVFNNDYHGLQLLDLDDELSDLRYIFLAIQYGKLGMLDRLEKAIEQVKEQSVIIFYKDLIRIITDEEIKDNKLSYLACIYKYYKNGDICIMDSNEDHQGILTFYKAKNYFYENEYTKSAQLFLIAYKNPKIRDISLENAIYSLFHAGNYEKALEIAKDANDLVRNKISFLISFIKGERLATKNGFLKEKGLDNFITKVIKEKISKGDNLTYLKDFEFETDNEELNFYMFLTSVINRKAIDENVKKNWSKNVYNSIMSLILKWNKKDLTYDNVSDKKEIEIFLEESGLNNYFPFNFLLAEIAFENNNFDKAQKIYEYFIRYPKNISARELSLTYYKLAMIFKNKKSYYTALKLLEKNLSESFDSIRDKSRVEYLKILMLRDNCDEIIIYAPIFTKDMKNNRLKDEINEIFNFCNSEKNKSDAKQEVVR